MDIYMLNAYKKGNGFKMTATIQPSTAGYRRTEVIYGRKYGVALTLDVFQPETNANRAGVMFLVSEGWFSDHSKIDENFPLYIEAFVNRGYTVFAVCHGGNPKFTLPEYIEDVHRAARFIRFHADRFGISAHRLGATGDSAGAHLALMLGCGGSPGNSEAEDPVERTSSSVGAVVAFFPPTDFLNWGTEGMPMLGNHPAVPVKAAFDFQWLDEESGAFEPVTEPSAREEIGRSVSPITHAHGNSAPALIIHGDADELIPHQQSQRMHDRLREVGAVSELILMPGGGHDGVLIERHLPDALDWFDRFLVASTSNE